MSRYMVRIGADGQIEKLPCKGVLELETLQQLVGGYIETVPTLIKKGRDGVRPLLIVNEEGRLEGLPLNGPATLLANGPFEIVGDTVLVGASGAELIGLDRETADRIVERLSGMLAGKDGKR